jgi:hypothetical protein
VTSQPTLRGGLPLVANPLKRLRRLCLALPDAHEVEAWGAPTFRVRNKLFAMYASPGTHHGSGRHAVWCKAGPGNQALMVAAAPARFFVPPYVGPGGWIGVYLDQATDWAELAELLEHAYRLTAPKRLLVPPKSPSVSPVAGRTRNARRRSPQ